MPFTPYKLCAFYYTKHFPRLRAALQICQFQLLFGEKEFLPTAAFSKLSGYTCNVMVINTACAALLGSLGGYSPGQLNKVCDVFFQIHCFFMQMR